ncbi:MAG TPA: hypothetical protein VMT86_06455 [Bryobacteraceae bacterium]|nr:hypothetical protein [Bryobacteraceae bacterium]
MIGLTVEPATITFDASNPDWMPTVTGSAPASISWQNLDRNPGMWSLSVQADAGAFSNCHNMPVSAVTVSCASAITNAGKSGACRPPLTLSASPQVVASGKQGAATFNYSVSLTFALADDWKYIAQTNPPCALSLTYIATVP